MGEVRKLTIKVDEEFNSIVLRDIKLDISKAFISIEANLRSLQFPGSITEHQMLLIKEKALQMKNELNDFIDAQVNSIVGGTRLQAGTGADETEKKPIIINEERAKYGLCPISGGDVPIMRIDING